MKKGSWIDGRRKAKANTRHLCIFPTTKEEQTGEREDWRSGDRGEQEETESQKQNWKKKIHQRDSKRFEEILSFFSLIGRELQLGPRWSWAVEDFLFPPSRDIILYFSPAQIPVSGGFLFPTDTKVSSWNYLFELSFTINDKIYWLALDSDF